jgi:hypothetical protein
MGYCTHESRLVLRSAEIQPLIPRFVRFSLFDLNRLEFKSAPPSQTLTHHSNQQWYTTITQHYLVVCGESGTLIRPYPLLVNSSGAVEFLYFLKGPGVLLQTTTSHSPRQPPVRFATRFIPGGTSGACARDLYHIYVLC